MKSKLILLLLLLGLIGQLQAQTVQLKGKVLSADEKIALPGATIRIQDSKQVQISDAEGAFQLTVPNAQLELVISFIGFKNKVLFLTPPFSDELLVYLEPDLMNLDGVNVFATGYQEIPKERQTGSFVGLDEELINRRISTSILDRLEDVTPGLIFNRTGASTDRISIRGRSTIFSNASPLIIIDNFPYDGPIENINPNDVASISVLRDAAAASIWGARAGNGVIVITTKTGKTDQGPQVGFTANSTWTERPDAFYRPLMSSGEVVAMEQRLFEQNFYLNQENSPFQTPLTPVVESLIQNRDGLLSDQELTARLAAFSNQDVRNDYNRYLYQSGINQQYNLNVRGGSGIHRYFISAGWDSNRENLVSNQLDRYTLLANQNLRLWKDRLDLGLGINYIQSRAQGSNDGPESLRFSGAQPLYAYGRLVDEEGNPSGFYSGIREDFARSAEAKGLLPWQLNPLEELNAVEQSAQMEDLRLNLSANLKLTEGISAELYYQFWSANQSGTLLNTVSSFAARDLINRFTQESPTGQLSYPIPRGGIFNQSLSQSESHNFRGMLRADRRLGENGQINAIAGYEVKTFRTDGRSSRLYGYQPETGIGIPVDYVTLFGQYPSPAIRATIPFNTNVSGAADNFISYFFNGSYSLREKYTWSLSARRDASNLFGVATNQKAVPLWSTGFAWTISQESWSLPSWVDYLRVRTTYGINGNVNKSVSALTTARLVGTSRYTALPVANISNPPNPNLSWEQIKIWNLGLDFDLFDERISGSFEVYRKEGNDLIGDIPLALNTGVDVFRGNFASSLGKGFDFQLAAKLTEGMLKWRVDYFHSHIVEEVVDYEVETTVLNYLGQATGASPSSPIFPLTGRPIYAVYSLPFAGLDPDTGDPLGILEGITSKDYAAIINTAKPEDLTFHGSARPTHFGSIRNTFTWGNWNLSANISYRLGYYYRRNSVRYIPILSGEQGHADYSARWQNPGDELRTQVPSLPSTRDSFRDNFYAYSSALVERGDHLRLQDVRLGYTFPLSGKKGSLELFSYANNLAILWKASDDPMDPDFPTMRPLRALTLGLRLNY
jgi:TonB-linked SusC/RagA family outer membrane protein